MPPSRRLLAVAVLLFLTCGKAYAQEQLLAPSPEATPPAFLTSLEGPVFPAHLQAMLERFNWEGGTDTQADSAIYSLRSKLQKALLQQPRLQAQRSRESESQLRIQEARAERRPQIDAGFEYRNDLQRNEALPDRGSRVDAVVTLSQLLFDFGASAQRVHSADLSAEAEYWQTRARTEDEVLYATNAYLEVARVSAQLELAEHNLSQHQRILDDVKARRDAGAGSRADVLRAESRLTNAQSNKVSLEGELSRALNAYQEAFFTTPERLDLPRAADFLAEQEISQLLEGALERNPSLQSSSLASQASKAEADATRNARFPRLSVAVEGRQFDVDNISDSDNDVALLFNVDYTPYSGGATSARIGQAEERRRQARFEQDSLKRELEREVNSAYTDTLTRLEELKAQARSLAAEEQALMAYREQFGIGRSSINDLLDAQRDLHQAATELVNRRIRWEEASFQQLAITGQLLDVMEITVEPHG